MAFSNPQHNIDQLNLSEGLIVADLGSGLGHYSIAAAKAVGDIGKVYAVDVQKDLLEKLKTLARHEGVGNIEIIWGDIENLGGTRLANLSIDVVLISNTLFQVEDRDGLMKEVNRILRPKGRVLVVDWTDSFGGLGPAPESVFKESQAKELFKKNNFSEEKTIIAGDHHYGIIFRKN